MSARESKEYKTFVQLANQVLSVPHAEIKKCIEEHRQASALNSNRRGPKRKVLKPSLWSGSTAF
jgi:hypothetical protein